ncbi:unnamed protein product [Ostreobium quekettii]|uniref:Uncharacterized protein n=1 Tax=Ostreobium quekettii TaxID=121088 RepID=A0A8S1JCK1_9CHLO|nr:unnamed protein product [Ostreobium quekettii]
MKSSLGCKVYGSLLALAYLEAVVWTSCVFLTFVLATTAADSHEYLIRETVNLKCVGGQVLSSQVAKRTEIHETELFTWVESRCRLRHIESLEQEKPECSSEQRIGLRLIYGPEYKGVPAPSAGVKVIL